MAFKCSNALVGVIPILSAVSLFAGPVPPITVTPGSAFTVNFDGAVGFPTPTTYAPLSATINFSDFAFTDIGSRTRLTFRTDISNTSTAPLTGSQVSVLGFNTTPTIADAGSSVSGAFDNIVIRDDMPFFGRVEFCMSDVFNCGGVGGTGVAQGTTGTAYASLFFAGAGLREVTIDNLALRYQGLTGVSGVFNGVGSPVPEPVAFVVLAAGIGLIALRPSLYRRRSS